MLRSLKFCRSWILLLIALVLPASIARAQVAPTPNRNGPAAVTAVDYKFPAAVDSLVTRALPTEIWAVLWRPRTLANRRLPIVVLIHGNHSTCGRRLAGSPWRVDDRSDYTTTGRCPSGYVVVPNHRGYDYLARKLASWGMFVLSINLNRGITAAPGETADPGLILRRARMTLRHLTLLAAWDSGAIPPPNGLGFNPRRKFDFSRIALMGHSRGGDTVVAVPRVFATGTTWRSRLPRNTAFPLLMALAPTDFQAARPIPGNAVFSTLLPMCDGDVVDMQGIRFFDRALKLTSERSGRLEKSSYQVWGTNHNGYNTEWHQSDAPGCIGQGQLFPSIGHSSRQQTIALNWVLGLVRSTLLGASTMDRLVDPSFGLPTGVLAGTLIDRGFVPTIAGRTLVHALDSRLPGGCGDKVAVTSGVQGSCTRWPEHDPNALVTLVRWGLPATSGSAAPAVRFRAGRSGNLNLSRSSTLDIQFGPDCFRSSSTTCGRPSSQYPTGTPSTFNQRVSVILEDTSGRFSRAVRMDLRASSRGPIATRLSATTARYHALLRTARIPMSAFGTGFSNANVRYVWLDFRPSTRGGFIVGEISGQSISVPGSTSTREGDAPEIHTIADGTGEPTTADEGAVMAEAKNQRGDAIVLESVTLPPPSTEAGNDAAEAAPEAAPAAEIGAPGAAPAIAADASRDRNRIVSITRRRGVDRTSGEAGVDLVRIEVVSSRPFPVTSAGLTLRIGTFTMTEPDPFLDGTLRRAVFEVPATALKARAKAGDAVSVDAWASMPAWQFGGLDERALR
jgi:hypothetical protein